jgi:hypothetical protein
MQKRAVRISLLALLILAGGAAGYITWETSRGLLSSVSTERDIEDRFDRMRAAIASLISAQQAYVAPGQQRGEALTQATTRIQQLYEEIAGLRRVARSAAAPATLMAIGEKVDALVKIDDRARDHLRADQELMAADLLYTEARQTVDAMPAPLVELQAAERASAAAEQRALLERGAGVVGSAVLLWIVGVLLLVRLPEPREATSTATLGLDSPQPEASVQQGAPIVDLDRAAAVCVELSKLSSGAALAPVLVRAARVLDASGLVVWIGAGEELFPATAHGYGSATLARIGPIARSADNATATAWRTGTMSVVDGDGRNHGALAVPLFGAAGCFGVLAAEMRHGREHDPSTRAVAVMIAAQLSAVVAPGPAPSAAESEAGRTAAASA